MRLWFLALALSLSAEAPDADLEIRKLRIASNHAMRDKNWQAFGAILDAEYKGVRGNGTELPSREAYIESVTASASTTRFERITEKVQVSEFAPVAAEHGHWNALRPGGAKMFGGTYLAMWRKGAAGWKLRSELFVVLECDDKAACAAYRK